MIIIFILHRTIDRKILHEGNPVNISDWKIY